MIAVIRFIAAGSILYSEATAARTLVKCGAAVLDACYEEAAKVCPSGYDIADKQTLRGPNVLLVECKAQK